MGGMGTGLLSVFADTSHCTPHTLHGYTMISCFKFENKVDRGPERKVHVNITWKETATGWVIRKKLYHEGVFKVVTIKGALFGSKRQAL